MPEYRTMEEFSTQCFPRYTLIAALPDNYYAFTDFAFSIKKVIMKNIQY